MAGIDHASDHQRSRVAERDFGRRISELSLNELTGGERTTELVAVEGVSARGMPAELGGAQRAPGDAIVRG